MITSNSSNLASPQALAILELATRYLLENEFALASELGEAVDALLVEEDEETLDMVSSLLYEKDPEASEDFWDFARERAEMFMTETGQISTLFAIPVLDPNEIQGFSPEEAAASFFEHGLVCEDATVLFYPAPVDGGQLMSMSPVAVFRLHTALGENYREAATLLTTQEYAQGTHPFVCFIGVATYSAQMPGECLAWEMPSDDFVRRIQDWSEQAAFTVLGLEVRRRALGYPGRFVFAVREGAQEYQDIVLEAFVAKVAQSGSGKVLARLKDHPILEGLTLELYDVSQEYGAVYIPWKQLGQARADVIEHIFDLLRDAGVLGIMFHDYDTEEAPKGVRH
ncbi:DUF2863 family protein [Acidithiobacillus ferriphilus]|uniref:DUF2863 family protein n=1 Tax=Acidithiobacillus ferriphilus TaxID=1689834 RepID=UPI001C0732BF|nr:DUF2863 family protein [Acidithiobacillus ferriphilus]MBU2854859.1 DUF2863 family protein [Acidithiobacillus ferriphilus]